MCWTARRKYCEVYMANLTLVIDDDILLRARKRALDQGTSVNAVLRKYLEGYAGRQNRSMAMRRFIQRATSAGRRRARAAARSSTLRICSPAARSTGWRSSALLPDRSCGPESPGTA